MFENFKITFKITFPDGFTASNDSNLQLGNIATPFLEEGSTGLLGILTHGTNHIPARNIEYIANSMKQQFLDEAKNMLARINPNIVSNVFEKQEIERTLTIDKDKTTFFKYKNQPYTKAKLPNQNDYKSISNYDIVDDAQYSFLSIEERNNLFFPDITIKYYTIQKLNPMEDKYMPIFRMLAERYLMIVKQTITSGTQLLENAKTTLYDKIRHNCDTRPFVRTGRMLNAMQCSIYCNKQLVFTH